MYERSRNAYLLFYERVVPIKENSQSLVIKQLQQKKFINGIESSVYQRIWDENAAFMKLKIFFDQEYFSFAREYVSLYNFENVLFFKMQYSLSFKYDAMDKLARDFIDLLPKSRFLRSE